MDLSGVHHNWGYYYHKIGDYNKAIKSFQMALELNSENYSYHKHLGFSLYEVGRNEVAYQVFQRSLAIEPNQPDLRDFMEKYNFSEEPRSPVGASVVR